jgi:hypothetical protein
MRDPMEALEAWLERRPALWAAYLRLNFCKASLTGGRPKPPSRAFDLFHRIFYLKCPCCACLRGALAGALLGFLGGFLCR